jgi:hypothetical protein
MKTIQEIKARSVEHTAAIRALSLSAEGRVCADAMVAGVEALLTRAEQIAVVEGQEAAFDVFYGGLVEVYRGANWGQLNWRDKFALSSTASWRDMASWRALKASIAIGAL